MRKNPTHPIEQYRVRTGPLASNAESGANGAFMMPGPLGTVLAIIVSDGSDWQACGLKGQPWEHVSVSTRQRCPTWEEMVFVKEIFWRDDETVLQFHVPKDQHINCHPYCLHLWKPTRSQIPLPPPLTVAPALSPVPPVDPV